MHGPGSTAPSRCSWVTSTCSTRQWHRSRGVDNGELPNNLSGRSGSGRLEWRMILDHASPWITIPRTRHLEDALVAETSAEELAPLSVSAAPEEKFREFLEIRGEKL